MSAPVHNNPEERPGLKQVSFSKPGVDTEVYPWQRLIARIIDGILFGLVLGMCMVPCFVLGFLDPSGLMAGIGLLVFLGIMLASIPIYLVVEAFMLSKWGSTPGKMLFGLSVMDSDGENLAFGAAFMRSLGVLGFQVGASVLNLFGLGLYGWQYMALTKDGHTAWDRDRYVGKR